MLLVIFKIFLIFLQIFYTISCPPASEISHDEHLDLDTKNAVVKLAYRDATVLKQQENSTTRNFWRDPKARWPGGKVYYELSSSYTSRDLNVIRDAISEWERKTCVRFIRRTSQSDYVLITPSDGSNSYCYSYVGRVGGRQIMKMYGECLRRAAMIHELGHVIGFNHEHQRPDRDDYIVVHYENINRNYHYAFDRFESNQVDTMGTPFDYKSVMQYPFYAFTDKYDERKPSMTDKKGSIEPIRREANDLSQVDIMKTKKYYNDCK